MNSQNNPDLKQLKKLDNALLKGLSDQQIEQVSDLMILKKVEKGDLIIKEGDISDDVYVILEGKVDIIKKERDSGEYYHLASLGYGESIGEVSLLDNEPRSASVVATQDSLLCKIGMEDLNSVSTANDSVSSLIKVNFAKEMGRRLRNTNETTVTSLHNKLQEARTRVAMGTVICWLMVGICAYILALQSITILGDEVASTTVISILILAVLGLMTLAAIVRSGYPLSFYGLTTKNWKWISLESILLSIPVLLIVLLGKWFLMTFTTAMKGAPLLEWSAGLDVSRNQLIWDMTLYTLFIPVQEFVARGGVQSSFQHFLTDKHKDLYAILIANLMFSITHAHLSAAFAIIVFIPGLFWGWMYRRHQSIIGVCVSHVLIGLIAYYVIGFHSLM